MRLSIIPDNRRAWFWLLLRLTLFIVVPIVALLWYMMAIPGKSYRGALAPLSMAEQTLADRFRLHVQAVASAEHNTQHPEALAAAARYLDMQLAGMGYQVGQQVYVSDGIQVRNLEVEIKGSTKPEEIILVGAHYDSARGAPGANDNGSGTAMVLELARSFKSAQPQRSLRFVLFTNEEPPHFGTVAQGAHVYAKRSRQRGENIVAMLSLETLGHFDDRPGSQKYPSVFKPFYPDTADFIGFIGDLESRALMHRAIAGFRAAQDFPSEGVAAMRWIHGIGWSDHAAFWAYDYRALMITDTAPFRYPHYHTHEDTPDRLDYPRMARVYRGIRAVVADLAGVSVSAH